MSVMSGMSGEISVASFDQPRAINQIKEVDNEDVEEEKEVRSFVCIHM